MNEVLNYPVAVMFILKNMYFGECNFEPELDEEGNQKISEDGKTIQKAVHSKGYTFREWCEKHDLILKQSNLVDSNNRPIRVGTPNFKK
jgi:hypothetical protein